MSDYQPIIDAITEQWRQRQDLHKEEKALTLRIKAKCRALTGGSLKEADKLYEAMASDNRDHPLQDVALMACLPFFEARSIIESNRKQSERYLVKVARDLPAYNWMKSVRGFGELGFVSIIGEAGDLCNYRTHQKLWKRFGLAVMEDGTRQRMVSGPEGADHGYNPQRRSMIWTIGEAMLRTTGPYKDLLDQRKQYEIEKAEAKGMVVLPSAQIPTSHRGGTYPNQTDYMSKGHVHNRAKRFVEKRLLKDLWVQWRSEVNERVLGVA